MNIGFYKFARALIKGVLAVIHPVKVHGAENIPTEGPAIVCGNHISMRDPFIVAVCLKPELRFMGKKELWDIKILRPILDAIGGFPVDRGASDISALRTSVNILKEQQILGIFPEGTRNEADGEQHAIQSGVASIALRGKAKLVPLYIQGPYRLFRPIHITFGKPLDYSAHEGRIDRAAIDRATEEIGSAIWSLSNALPEGKAE